MPYRDKGEPEGKWKTQKARYAGAGNPKWRGGDYVLVCSFCHNQFTRTRKQGLSKKGTFCSQNCYQQSRPKPRIKTPISELRGEKHGRWGGKRCCKVCGKELLLRRERQRKVCSKECGKKVLSLFHSGANNKLWKSIPQKPCNRCGKMIGGSGNGVTRPKFCSRECAGLWKSEHRKPPEPYPPEWTDNLKSRIRRRDNFTCQDCGFYNKGNYIVGSKLDVHHIDWNKYNCDPSNLVALCRKCHRGRHRGYKRGKYKRSAEEYRATALAREEKIRQNGGRVYVNGKRVKPI